MMLALYLLIIVYIIAISILIYGFTKINSFETIELLPKTKFSIVVPFRNEAKNLPILLESFSKLNYPTDFFEVVLVDDASDSRFQIMDYGFQILMIDVIRTSNSPKKDAITTAMRKSKNEWIITTDADCVVPENWLLVLDNYIQLHSVAMIASSVTYDCQNTFLHHFQQMDFASLQGATMGSFGIGKGFMCNGANFVYKKTLFETLNGFESNDSIASGDDVFLLQKAIAWFPEKVHYLKSSFSIISTKPLNDWKSLFYQRVRWASKTGSYKSGFGIGLGLVVFGGNVGWLLILGFMLLGIGNYYIILVLLLSKILVDFVLINKTNLFLKAKTRSYLFGSLLYPFFGVIVALYSIVGKYEWKGRRF